MTSVKLTQYIYIYIYIYIFVQCEKQNYLRVLYKFYFVSSIASFQIGVTELGCQYHQNWNLDVSLKGLKFKMSIHSMNWMTPPSEMQSILCWFVWCRAKDSDNSLPLQLHLLSNFCSVQGDNSGLLQTCLGNLQGYQNNELSLSTTPARQCTASDLITVEADW
jgi:hypothetical protein